MAAFYGHNEGYAEQQGSHDAGYFGRLLGVMEAVLSGLDVRILEVGAGSAGAMRGFLTRKPDARAVVMELSSGLDGSCQSSCRDRRLWHGGSTRCVGREANFADLNSGSAE
jgi:hypothetical protein